MIAWWSNVEDAGCWFIAVGPPNCGWWPSLCIARPPREWVNVEILKQTKTVSLPGGGTADISGVPQPGRVDLFVARKALVKDLSLGIGGITAVGTTFLPGDNVTLKVAVHNEGNLAVQNVEVAFYDGDPAQGGTPIGTATIAGWLRAADEQEVSISWTIPALPAAHTVFAVVDPSGHVTESNEANNSNAISLNGPDLQLACVTGSALRDGSVRVVARVKALREMKSVSSKRKMKRWRRSCPPDGYHGRNRLLETTRNR